MPDSNDVKTVPSFASQTQITTKKLDRRSFVAKALGGGMVTLGAGITSACIPTTPACDYDTTDTDVTILADPPRRTGTDTGIFADTGPFRDPRSISDRDVTRTADLKGDRCR